VGLVVAAAVRSRAAARATRAEPGVELEKRRERTAGSRLPLLLFAAAPQRTPHAAARRTRALRLDEHEERS